MFLKQHFYHQHIRKAIIAFGTIFNQITVERKNADGVISQALRVPLSYAPKQKFLSRITGLTSNNDPYPVATILPRIGFEITGLQYNPSKKLSVVQKSLAVGTNDEANKVRTQYVSTPYDLDISLYILTKNQDDGLQILEQILPFFNPDFNVSINDVPEMGIKRDLQIVLESIGYEDIYEGSFTERQSVVWTLNFRLGLNFYGPVSVQGYIKTAIVNTYIDDGDEKSTYQVSYTPEDASVLDEWEYVEQFDAAQE